MHVRYDDCGIGTSRWSYRPNRRVRCYVDMISLYSVDSESEIR